MTSGNENTNVFVTNLKILLRKKGIKQEVFAEALDVSQSTVNRWLSGKTAVNIDQMLSIAKFLKVHFYTLCYDYENNLDLLDMTNPSHIEFAKHPLYKMARELGYPVFTQEIE